ncbi:MAG TPA: PAS domain-containing protein, partial [Rhodothermales bacterium]|nr:PAS domain-containing protein [Rhodothermales bacterium]
LLGRTPMEAGFWRSAHERRERLLLFRRLPIEGRQTAMRRLDTGEDRRVEVWADRIVVGGEECWAGVFLDVEAHLRAEEALQAERDFVQSVLDALGEGVVVADAEDRFAYVNPAFARLIGADVLALVGQPIGHHVAAEDRHRYSAETARRRVGEASSYELRFLHADGSPRPVLVTGVPIRAGRYAGGVAAVVTDLSVVKAAQAELQRLKEYYEEILDRLPLQLATFDAEARYRYINPAAIRDPERRRWILGHTSPEYAEQYQFSATLLAERYRHEREAIEQRRKVQWVETLHTPVGPRHFERVVTPVLDASGAFQFAIAYGIEVTERLEAERRLRQLKNFYESILEHLPLRVVVFDREGHLAFANAEVLSDEEQRARLMGKSVVEAMRAAGLSAEAAERLQRHLDEARRTGAVQTWEEQAGPAEAPRTLLFAVRPLADPDASYVGYALDVTERRQYEQGLVDARERAEELAQLKSAFLANMSHEVRTPLAGIIGFAEVLEDELEGSQREAAALVRESGMRLLETLNSVLDLARLESDATELKLAPLDVRSEIEAVARLFGPTAERKGLTFDIRLPEDGAPLRAMLDSAALHRVLANLVSNAIKFTDRGSITLEVARVNDHLALHVRDTGCGMSTSFLPHVFEEFRQESSGLTRAHQGSGLGLAITKRLVDMLHGTITVESTVGRGT